MDNPFGCFSLGSMRCMILSSSWSFLTCFSNVFILRMIVVVVGYFHVVTNRWMICKNIRMVPNTNTNLTSLGVLGLGGSYVG